MLLSASLLLLVVCVQANVNPPKQKARNLADAAAASRSTAKPALFVLKSPDKTRHHVQSVTSLPSTNLGMTKPRLLRALQSIDVARSGHRNGGARGELRSFGDRNANGRQGYHIKGQTYSPAMSVSKQELGNAGLKEADTRQKSAISGSLSANYYEKDHNVEQYLQTKVTVGETTGMKAIAGKDNMYPEVQTGAQGITTKRALSQGLVDPQQGMHPDAKSDETTKLEGALFRKPVYGQSDIYLETKRGDGLHKTEEEEEEDEEEGDDDDDDDEYVPVFSGSPAEFKLDKDLEMEALDAGITQANPNGLPIPIHTRSLDDPSKWTCRQHQEWRQLGENVYPSRLWETVCERGLCYHDYYNCTPIYYTLHVLKACDHRCQDERVPFPLRSRWQWYSLNVTVGCQCGR